MFKPVDTRQSFPKLEEEVLHFWKDNEIFQKSVEQRPEDKTYVFYEGPPTANAAPGIHHVLARAFKDLFPRYKTMRGYRVPRKGGWDTHGLPVELEVEKELGFKNKRRDRGVRRRGVQQALPRERVPLRAGVGDADRAHRLLGRHGGRLPHLRRLLHRDRLVDHQAPLGQRPRLPGLPLDAPLPALRHVPGRPRSRARLQGRHARPVGVREVPPD